jgi:hypothetical protein
MQHTNVRVYEEIIGLSGSILQHISTGLLEFFPGRANDTAVSALT